MNLKELYELTGKVLKERPDLAEKEIKQVQGCTIHSLWQEVPTSNSFHLLPELDAKTVKGGVLWQLT
jgi:sulfur transfer protein SufE